MTKLDVVAFDADDTLWVNETYFRKAEQEFCDMMAVYMPKEKAAAELFAIEMKNMSIYGYGVKAFTLSMLEAALVISNNTISPTDIQKVIDLGKDILSQPVELLNGVEEVLDTLAGKYKLVVATKGDLLDQERKIKASGVEHYFHHTEIMSNKQTDDYRRLLSQLKCEPTNFMMIGNSLKSDVLPVIELGGQGVHIPFHVTWGHEVVADETSLPDFIRLDSITEILPYLT